MIVFRYEVGAVVNLRRYFLIDGVGALLSALTIGLILPHFSVGMPAPVLTALAGVALGFSVYSLVCAAFKYDRPAYLRFIAICNMSYCILTAALVVYFYDQLSWIGRGYFSLEVAIIVLLAVIELRIVRKWSQV